MDNKNTFYTLGRDLAIKKKFPPKRIFPLIRKHSDLDYKTLYSRFGNLYAYLVSEYEKNPEIVPLAASWILDNYYLVSQQYVLFEKTFKTKLLKKLPLSEYDRVYYQIHYIAKKYLEATNCSFSEETLIPFLRGYQKIYPLSSLEIWILPTTE